MKLLENAPETEIHGINQLEKDRFNEQELTRLQRELRFQTTGAHGIFFKEKFCLDREIKKRTKENTEIDTIINAVMSKSHVNKIERKMEFILMNVECQKHLDQEILINKLYIQQIQSQIERLYKEELKLKKIAVTDHQHNEQLRKSKLNYEIKLGHLEVSKNREGKLCQENKKLKKIIERMMYERAIFNKHWEQLVSELSYNKRFLTDLIERSIFAFTKDEEYFMRIETLKKQGLQTKNSQVAEILSIFRKLDADKMYHEFLQKKGVYRQLVPLNEHETKRRELVERELRDRFNLHNKIIEKILEKFSRTKEAVKTTPSKPIYQAKNKNEEESDFEKRKSLLKEVIDEYIQTKECHFANFKYLNDIYNQFEFMVSSNERKQIKLDSERENQKANKAAIITQIKDLSATLVNEKQITILKQKEQASNEILLKNYMEQICEIFKAMNCDTQFIQNLLGNNKMVTNFNIKLFLSTMESTINKMLAYIYYREKKTKIPVVKAMVKILPRDTSLTPVINIVSTTQCSECGERSDVNRYDETTVFPRSKIETKEKIKKQLLANELNARMHNLSKCRLPKSRVLVNKRYL